MEITIKGLSQSGDLGFRLTRLRIRRPSRYTSAVVVAEGFYLEPEFLVLRDSEAFVETAPAFGETEGWEAFELREALIADGTLAPYANVYAFQRDYVFRSVSLAASVILGRSVNGTEEWRDVNGTNLADLLAEPAPA